MARPHPALVDLAAGGQWFEPGRLSKLERQAKQLSDAYLPGAMHVLRRLIVVGRDDDLDEEERNATGAGLIMTGSGSTSGTVRPATWTTAPDWSRTVLFASGLPSTLVPDGSTSAVPCG